MEYKTLSDRMKGAYENRYRNYLPENFPVIIRLDGAHFHSFCRGMKKPFGPIFVKTMQQTMLKLCEIIPNVKFGYVESDEISLVMIQSERNSQPWFDNNIQKIVSTSAALCTLWFNNYFAENTIIDTTLDIFNMNQDSYDWKMVRKGKEMPTFDSRVFVVPTFEVHNYFVWRQQDCTRNSIQAVAQSLYSQKELHGINTTKLQDKMFTEKGVNWNDYTTVEKRGTCAYRIPTTVIGKDGQETIRYKWILDYEMPILTSEEGKDFISQKVFTNESV